MSILERQTDTLREIMWRIELEKIEAFRKGQQNPDLELTDEQIYYFLKGEGNEA